jgi:hypothetical protein
MSATPIVVEVGWEVFPSVSAGLASFAVDYRERAPGGLHQNGVSCIIPNTDTDSNFRTCARILPPPHYRAKWSGHTPKNSLLGPGREPLATAVMLKSYDA